MTTLFSLLLSSAVNFTLKSQMWICDQWPIVFCDFYGQSLKTEFSISWSTSLNLTQPLACRIPISSPLGGTLSQHFPCPLPILLDSLQEQEAKSGHKWLTEAWGLLSSPCLDCVYHHCKTSFSSILRESLALKIICLSDVFITFFIILPGTFCIETAWDLLSYLKKSSKVCCQNESDTEFYESFQHCILYVIIIIISSALAQKLKNRKSTH